jgi:diguanylate cyclase (GGDEF)-like protein
VGRSITSALRESDLAARWGGEEFLVVTAASDELQILQLADRLRALVAASDTTIDGRQLGVTVSIGATLAAPADTVDTLVERADRAMYQSKTDGRNRTTFA